MQREDYPGKTGMILPATANGRLPAGTSIHVPIQEEVKWDTVHLPLLWWQYLGRKILNSA